MTAVCPWTPRLVGDDEPRKRRKPPKSYRDFLKSKGVKMPKIQRTKKQPGDLELIGNGKMVEVK